MSSTLYDHERIAQRRAKGDPWKKIAKEDYPGHTSKQVRQAHHEWRKRRGVDGTSEETVATENTPEFEFRPRSGRLSGKGSRTPLTLDDLMEVSGLKREEWEVMWFRPGYSEIGAKDPDGVLRIEKLFNAQARLKPLVGASVLEDVKREVIEEVREASTIRSRPHAVENPPQDPRLGEVVLMDIHLGMLSWRMETGADYDMHIVEDMVKAAVNGLLDEAAGQNIAQWLLPLGNDFFHTDQTIDGKGGATTAGTPQDVDSRWQKAFRAGRQLMQWTIDRLLEVAPVDALVVPGNHDEAKAWFLGEVLDAYYHADPNVRIDNRPILRKYHAWGNTLLGFTHGQSEKVSDLPNIMATAAPEAWGRSRFREWHMGHRHTEIVTENKGVRCRFLPAMTGTDAWHFKKGFVGNQREARLMLWTQDRGRAGEFDYNVVPTPEHVETLGPALNYIGTPYA